MRFRQSEASFTQTKTHSRRDLNKKNKDNKTCKKKTKNSKRRKRLGQDDLKDQMEWCIDL
jgi:hypothetical protein